MSNGTISLSAAVLCASAVFAVDDVTCARFPDADSVLLEEKDRVVYDVDGTSERWDEAWTKVLTEKGRREESVRSLSYSKRYGTGEIVSVGIVGTNGVERTVDVSKTTKESTDNGSMAANIYDPLDRKIVCRIPGLQVGETVHVKTHTKTERPRTEGKWSDISVMEWTCPILKATYEVTAPAGLPLRKKAVRNPLGNVLEATHVRPDGSTVHVFTVTNAPQAFPEPDMPPLYTQVQNVRVSTAEDWPEISRWYWDLCASHLAKTNAAMAAKVTELGPDLRAIFRFVSQEIRYMGLTMEDTSPGYAPHDVDVTFDNRYGVCRDKAALLVAMLRMAGFNAFPVLIHAGAKLDPDVPQPFFNHAIVAVDRGRNEYELMDPTNENTKDIFPAYLCDKSYLVARPEGDGLRLSPTPSPEHNALTVSSKGSLAKDGSAFLENDIAFGGINDTLYRQVLVKRKPEDRIKFFERIVTALAPGADLVRCEIEPGDLRDTETSLRVRLAARLPELLLRGETRDELNVPFVSKGLGLVNFLLSNNTSLEKRRYPLTLDTTACVRESLRLELGDAVGRPLSFPSDSGAEEPDYRYERSFSVTNGTLVADRSLTVGAVEFSPEAYLKLREKIKSVEAAERRRVVFEKDRLADADVRYLLDSCETTVVADRAWVTTNVVVKQVLTYAGKKKSAELKFGYNPTWKSVELVSAVVSNRDGRVSAVTAKETNVMDCGWAASAPRYPAGKILVVNLPGVELGSVISYTVVTAVTNAPTGFYAAYDFDSFEPVDRKVVRVNAWRREETDLKRLPNEPFQPSAALWRDRVVVSSNRFESVDLQIGELDPAVLDPKPSDVSVVALRDWMAKYVKVTGPGLYEVPMKDQLTPPETVVGERYATRLDYVRTLCALLRGAGFESDVVFSQLNGNEQASIRRSEKYERPNVRAFASALCRVKVREGGFLGFGGEEKTFFIGTENEYTPLGATAYAGCDFFDPKDCTFGEVTVPEEGLCSAAERANEIVVRANGAVDMVLTLSRRGVEAGAFRRKYAEMLPEDRSRHHQALLGAVAQAASATSELETDVTGYPATRRFACYVPDYAVVDGDSITIQVPVLDCPLPNLTGTRRLSPFEVGAETPEEQVVKVVFPEGYVEVEHLPEPFAFADPSDPTKVWLESRVATEVKDGVLTVTLTRTTHERRDADFPPSFFALVKDWRRCGTSRANRTITVRRGAAE